MKRSNFLKSFLLAAVTPLDMVKLPNNKQNDAIDAVVDKEIGTIPICTLKKPLVSAIEYLDQRGINPNIYNISGDKKMEFNELIYYPNNS